MKKAFAVCCLLFAVCAAGAAHAAITVKKAEPVAAKPSGGTDGAASLVPSVLGLVSNVIDMNAKQKALSEDCIPTSQEMTFVETTMKEWAKTGQTTAKELQTKLNRTPCPYADNGFESDVFANKGAPGLKPCFNHFAGPGNDYMVWRDFPKPGKGTYCKSGAPTCTGGDQITVSDTYDLFALIDFAPADYLPNEITMAGKLLNKIETCTDAKLNAKKKALWGDFLVKTVGGIGQKTNTGNIMEQVGAIAGGGGAGALSSVGAIATQFMNK